MTIVEIRSHWSLPSEERRSHFDFLKLRPRTIHQLGAANKIWTLLKKWFFTACWTRQENYFRLLCQSFTMHAFTTLTIPSIFLVLNVQWGWKSRSRRMCESDTVKNRRKVVKSRSVGNLSLTITSRFLTRVSCLAADTRADKDLWRIWTLQLLLCWHFYEIHSNFVICF